MWVRLYKITEQAKAHVSDHEDLEGVTSVKTGSCSRRRNGAQDPIKKRNQDEKKYDLVELGRMTVDAIAEVDAPWECGGSAISIVGESGQEAADATDGDAERKRNGVEVARRMPDANVLLHEFDGNEAKDKRADNGFPGNEVSGVVEIVPSELRILDPVKKLGPDRRASQGRGNDRPAQRSREGIAEALA